jgi:hypothetical protein
MADFNGNVMKESGLDKFFTSVRALEKQRSSRIWCMMHIRKSHICGPTMWSLYAGRPITGKGKKIEILLHSGGGHPDIAYAAMKFFRRRFEEVNVIVPLIAKSAATLMCLGADKIFMGEFAELGPIDIQLDDQVKHGEKGFSPLDEFKSLEFIRDQAIEWMDYYATVMNRRYGISIKEALKESVPLVSNLMRPLFEQIDPIEMGGNRRALAIGEEYANRMLELVGNPKSKEIIKKMVWDYPSHDFHIDFDEAEEVGLPVAKLSEAQDVQITEAIINLRREYYHGFAPPPPQATKTAAKPSRTVSHRARPANGRNQGRRVNGSGRGRPEERIGT